jgi:hypothetical protein
MGDAGEALIDAESRIQERMEELAREREERGAAGSMNPEVVRAVESLKLARIDLERQFAATAHTARKNVLRQAIDEIDRRVAALGSTSPDRF